jgi:threonine dehydrogenase-like Zn-dependent dehydrogenase
MPYGADVVFTGSDTLDMAVAATRLQGTISIMNGSWNNRVPDPALLSRQKTDVGGLPRLIDIAPGIIPHGNERWKAGQLRHNYDVSMHLVARGKVDVESFYRTVPYEKIDDMPGIFKDFHEREFKVAMQVGGN